MKRIVSISLAALLCLFSIAGCAQQENDMENTYQQITAQEAKDIMDSGKEHLIIDARTEEEFATGHIANAILIPEYEIADLRYWLDCEKKYLKTNDFCKYVIEAAVKEINRCSDTAVTPVFVKKGRSVTKVRFEIS
jgi:uncharacterized protein YacL